MVAEAGTVRRKIGVALQEAALDPLMTGRELLQLQATLHAISRQRGSELADSLLDRVGLTLAADRRVGTYSGGMQRRLDLAAALVHTPQVLFLDEPTTGLDPVSRQAIWEEVQKLNDEGTTVFLTTQYLEEADKLADRVGIISGGLLVAEGTPASLKAEVGQSAPRALPGRGGDGPAECEEILGALRETPPRTRRHTPGGARARGLRGGPDRPWRSTRPGLAVESLDLVKPTLDDVFVAKTGQHLEGDEKDTGESEVVAE